MDDHEYKIFWEKIRKEKLEILAVHTDEKEGTVREIYGKREDLSKTGYCWEKRIDSVTNTLSPIDKPYPIAPRNFLTEK